MMEYIEQGRTLLFIACFGGHVNIVELLIGIDKVDLNTQDSKRQRILLIQDEMDQ